MKVVFVLSFLSMVALCNITFKRTISDVHTGFNGSLVFDHGCESKDQYGSNDCTLNWGETYNVTYQDVRGMDITAGANFSIEAKVSFEKVNINCALCGANCTFTVVKKTISIPMPDCPIKATSTPQTIATFTLPKKDPLPIKVKASGEGTSYLADGSEILSVIWEATVKK